MQEDKRKKPSITFLQLYLTFLKIGATTFGGGYAMVPMIQREIVEEKGWIEEEEFLDSIALTNSLPGPLATNCAVFTGYRLKGFIGVAVATLGVITPSLVIILLLAAFLMNLNENPIVLKAFNGLRPAVAGLIGYSLVKMAKTNGFTPFNLVMSFLVFLAVCFLRVSPIWAILVSATVGFLLHRYPVLRGGAER